MREFLPADPFPSALSAGVEGGLEIVGRITDPGGETSASIKMLDDSRAAPYLVIKVNGVRIAARGGNWGMDDSRKRVSREHLEPYFRLHRDANLNIIRNWVGQNTEQVFYDLADEYGLMVWNDFWESTQNYNVEAQDPALFLDNVRDTISRFRNHPSIVVWCGRNEGVPQPIINEGIIDLVRALDGTRYYFPSSNQVNLQNSGPYKYMDPTLYYTTLNHGFSVETGTPSFSTLESFRAPGFRRKTSGRSATTGLITTGTRAETETWRRSWRRCRPSSAHRPAWKILSAKRRCSTTWIIARSSKE